MPLKQHFGSDIESSKEERDDVDIQITHPSTRRHKRNWYFGSDGFEREGASFPPIKKQEDNYEILIESSLHVTRILEGLYKALNELNVNSVEQLITYYVLSCHQEERGILSMWYVFIYGWFI